MERLENNAEMRLWNDHIDLRWKYTAGVAGDRFFQLLKQGKIQGSFCKNCKKTFVPPKIFCIDCFIQIDEWKDVNEDSGYLYSYTRVANKAGEKETIALVKYDGTEGGLLGKIKVTGGDEPKIGMKVKAVFAPKDSRKGELSDIAYFEKTNS